MKNKTVREKFEFAGHITVDAGMVQIGDPCYGGATDADWRLITEGGEIVELPHEGRKDGLNKAVAVSSGFGDGVYAIMVKRCRETDRIKEVKIKFF